MISSSINDLIFDAENVTVYFLKDILMGKKRHVKNDVVQSIFVPQYELLTIEKILNFAGQDPNLQHYLPDGPDIKKIPKQWMYDFCAAVIGQPFRDWVKEQIEDRNATFARKNQMFIGMDPQFAAEYRASTHVSRKCLSHPHPD